MTKAGLTIVAGQLKVSGPMITFHDLTGPFACRGNRAIGTYRWRLRGARLTLTPVREPCPGRRLVYTRPFTRIA
jgi:hypothetical protein